MRLSIVLGTFNHPQDPGGHVYRACLIAMVATCASVCAADAQAIPNCVTGEVVDGITTYSGDVAAYQVDMFGNVLQRPTRPVDENDMVIVFVNTTPAVAKLTRVRRTSATRPVGFGPIAGADDDFKANLATANQAATAPSCLMRVELGDFAPGRGEVQLEVMIADADKKLTAVPTGAFDVRVNPLYVGAFSLGPVRSTLADPTYDLAVVGQDSLIHISDAGERILYMFTFTPFVIRRRDSEKLERNLLLHINPSIGIALNDPAENAFAAVSIDVPGGFFFHYGWHVGRVTELSAFVQPGANGQVMGLTDVPTSERWVAKPFLGITMDLRAALRFLRTAGSTQGPS